MDITDRVIINGDWMWEEVSGPNFY